jgi:hypothetical protein
MKPFAKVKSPQVPSWSTAKLVLSPTKRPMAGAEADEEEPDPIARVNKYSNYVNVQLEDADRELQGIGDLNLFIPMVYMISDQRLVGDLDLFKTGTSLPVVSRFLGKDHV